MATIIPPGSVIEHAPNYYQSHAIQHDDIVIFHSPSDKRLIIKRVIAVPGDKLQIKDWSLYINGKQAKNSQNIEYEFRSDAFAAMIAMSPTVPENAVLLMGEPRKGSFDSSRLGFISTRSIVSRVVSY